jgi:hypothetical protein
MRARAKGWCLRQHDQPVLGHALPEMEDGDLEMRGGRLILYRTGDEVKANPSQAGYTYLYVQSRSVQYEDQAKTKEEKSARKSLEEASWRRNSSTSPSIHQGIYFQMEKQIDETLGVVPRRQDCQGKFADSGPSFGKLKEGIQEVRQVSTAASKEARDGTRSGDGQKPRPKAEGAGERRSRVLAEAGSAKLRHRTRPAEPEDRRGAIANGCRRRFAAQTRPLQLAPT